MARYEYVTLWPFLSFWHPNMFIKSDREFLKFLYIYTYVYNLLHMRDTLSCSYTGQPGCHRQDSKQITETLWKVGLLDHYICDEI